MALVQCKECKKPVAKSAKICPHCGVKNPALKTRDAVFGVVLICVAVFAIAKCSGGDNKPSVTEPTKAAAEDAKCKIDLQCWGEKNLAAASIYCKDNIERTAKYSVKWTDGTFDMKMTRYRWSSPPTGIVTYLGDKVQFQNGFGAWQNVVYECDFDPTAKRVLDVRVREGRL